jgi:predicted phage terminase large subunit-like protein
MYRAFAELNPRVRFLENWHNELIASKLEACFRGEITRLIVNIPPRYLKSHAAAVSFPAFVLGHNPSAQIICASYGQDLANKHSLDCRNLMTSKWYRDLFGTRISPQKQSVQEFVTTQNGFRMATSVGGVLTGRGADYIVIDDPLKPDEALSESQRRGVNEWFDHTLYSRLNDKSKAVIIIIMQRLHEDDLVGHVLQQEDWHLVRLPATAEEDEIHCISSVFGTKTVRRRKGEALHPERESLELLEHLRQTVGEYNFAGQYQQAPAPAGGGMVKSEWFIPYTQAELPEKFEMVFQSWDTANKPSELADYSVCTTWGVYKKNLYLRNVYRKKLDYPQLKRAVREQATIFEPKTILIEDKASGTQLIQELTYEGLYAVKKYQPTMDKVMRMHSVTSTIENGLVHIPERAPWVAEYLHEMSVFPNGRFDDQADSTSQALEWFKSQSNTQLLGLIEFYKQEAMRLGLVPPHLREQRRQTTICPRCGRGGLSYHHGYWRCANCGQDGRDYV